MNFSDIQQAEGDVDQDEVIQLPQANGDRFELLNNEGLDRDHQVWQVLLPLRRVLNIWLSSTAEFLNTDIDVTTWYHSIRASNMYWDSMMSRRTNKYYVHGTCVVMSVIEKI